jgi:multimeric flavodoxin WrbA
MKVIAINGSARPNGNTHRALEIIAEILQKKGINVEIIDLATKNLKPCLACNECMGKRKCKQTDDDINSIFEKLLEADGIIIGSPTYFANVSSRTAMFIERTGYISRMNKQLLKGKVGAAVAIARRQGATNVYAAINYYFGLAEMPIATSSYWNFAIAKKIGDIDKDEEGVETIKNLAENFALLLERFRK